MLGLKSIHISQAVPDRASYFVVFHGGFTWMETGIAVESVFFSSINVNVSDALQKTKKSATRAKCSFVRNLFQLEFLQKLFNQFCGQIFLIFDPVYDKHHKASWTKDYIWRKNYNASFQSKWSLPSEGTGRQSGFFCYIMRCNNKVICAPHLTLNHLDKLICYWFSSQSMDTNLTLIISVAYFLWSEADMVYLIY